MRHPYRLLCLMLAALVGLTACSERPPEAPKTPEPPGPRNVIFFLGDGMGASQVKAFRMLRDDPATPVIEALPFDGLRTGSVVTLSLSLFRPYRQCAT